MLKDMMPTIDRRAVLLGTASTLAAPAILRAQTRKTAKVVIGRQPWAAGNAPITQIMINDKTYEKAAAEAGYDLTVEWGDYPSAVPMIEAFVAGNLDLGMWGNTPIVRLIAQNQPINILTVGEGHMRFVLAVRPDSPIASIADCKNKTIGLLVGGDSYNAFSQMLLHELGNADPKAFGMTVVNTPTQAGAAVVPQGMDATCVNYPAFLQANAQIGTKGIMDSFGYTQAGYKGPAGEGAGILLPGVKKSAFYPDGYYLHRSFWVCNNRMVEQDAALGQAFLVAYQRALETMQKMKPEDTSNLVRKYWELEPAIGAKVVQDEVLMQRGWIWPTEGDAAAVTQISKVMIEGRQIPKALTFDQVKAAFQKAVPSLQKAYDTVGKVPATDAFTDKNAKDLRGPPAWRMNEWKTPA